MSSPGGDKSDLPDFNEFDLPADALAPAEDAAEPDFSDSGLMSPLHAGDDQAAEPPTGSQIFANEIAPVTFGPDSGVLNASEETAAAQEPKAEASQVKKEKKAKKPRTGGGLASRLARINPYTMMLTLALVALVISVLCLVMELSRFNFDVKAKEAKQRAAVTAPVHSVPVSTTAAA